MKTALHKELSDLHKTALNATRKADRLLCGVQVRITAKWLGKSYGRTYEVVALSFEGPGWFLRLNGERTPVSLDEVEFFEAARDRKAPRKRVRRKS